MHRSLRSSSMQHGKPRRQDRNSPLDLISAGLTAAGVERFTLDPASNARSLVNARFECWYGGRPLQIPRIIHPVNVTEPDPKTVWRGDGLEIFWPNFRHIFNNPPWNNSGAFMQKAAETAAWHRRFGSPTMERRRGRVSAKGWSVQMLVPLRTHRNYWKWAYTADAWCLLNPVTFEGFTEAMPTPCVWLYWGSDVARFRKAFHGKHGVVLTSLPEVSNLFGMKRKASLNDTADKLLDALLKYLPEEQLAEVIVKALPDATMLELLDLPNDIGGSAYNELHNATDRLLEGFTVGSLASAKKKAPKKVAKKKTAKKAAKKTTKKKAAKKAPEKKAAKKAPKRMTLEAHPPKVASKKKAPKKVASKKKAPKKVASKKAAKPTAVPKAANSAPAPGGSDKLDMAIVTQLLPGRTTPFRCKDVADTFHVSDSTALRSIRRLLSAGKIASTGDGRSKQYTSLVTSSTPPAASAS